MPAGTRPHRAHYGQPFTSDVRGTSGYRWTVIDATQPTKAYFQRLGQAATTLLFMTAGQFPSYPRGNTDNTHLQEGGARAIAELILAGLARQRLPIGRLVMTIPEAP